MPETAGPRPGKDFTVKKLIVLLAVAGIAVFAFSKVFGSKEEHEFGA